MRPDGEVHEAEGVIAVQSDRRGVATQVVVVDALMLKACPVDIDSGTDDHAARLDPYVHCIRQQLGPGLGEAGPLEPGRITHPSAPSRRTHLPFAGSHGVI
jgi:hypothetical protein